jgi:hypothetical protein
MQIILSGEYINPELAAQFGKIPPSFLPLGNRRLFHWQLQELRKNSGRVAITLPANFTVPQLDAAELRAQDVTIIQTTPGIPLGEAIFQCLDALQIQHEPTRILHGDTLCSSLDETPTDTVLTSQTDDGYDWDECVGEDGHPEMKKADPINRSHRRILCGYFNFASGRALVDHLKLCKFDFIDALNAYGKHQGLSTKEAQTWLDFGHLQTYFRSRARFSISRSFNQLTTTPQWVTKTSSNQKKILAEANWFQTISPELHINSPRFLGLVDLPENKKAYKLEYMYLATLAELFVFGQIPPYLWARINETSGSYLAKLQQHRLLKPMSGFTASDYANKTIERLESFCRVSSIRLDQPTNLNGTPLPSLSKIVETLAQEIPDAKPEDQGIMHGDFCFSNIMFDFQATRIVTLDPRGQTFDGETTIHGDTRYDVAKYAHSIIGLYDVILAGRFLLSRQADLSFDFSLDMPAHQDVLSQQFLSSNLGKHQASSSWVMPMTILLFLSMLPLHTEEPKRQLALLANALRLFKLNGKTK